MAIHVLVETLRGVLAGRRGGEQQPVPTAGREAEGVNRDVQRETRKREKYTVLS